MSQTDPVLQSLFAAAAEIASPAERARFLERECPDPALRREVESLLASHDQPDSLFLKETVPASPACEVEGLGARIGRYKLLEALGEGGFGTVWLAEQKEPVRRQVALKVIKLGMDTKQVVARFEAERQALALMDHPNIAKVLDAGTTDNGRPYFVMELVRGIPITKFCDENKLATRERLELFTKVCHAVQHAHQKGIIHRDLKPSNVLVTLHDGVPVPKVIDFGIAKATQQELTDKTIHTLFQQFIGTPAYVSPEQAEMSGLDVDTRSDIYSLGVLLYELLTGVTPFNAQTLVRSGLDEMRRIIREQQPERPSTRLNTLGAGDAATVASSRGERLAALIHLVSGDLDWIVMKCLEKDRTRRYETANGLAADITRHLRNEPIAARPPSKLYEFQRMVRRHKVGFAAAAVVIVALGVGVVISTAQAVRARRAERAALVSQRNEVQQRRAADASHDGERRARAELEHGAYLNSVALAHWNLTHEPPNIVEAEKLLESCKTERRGWEWSYLRRQWLVEPVLLAHPVRQGINAIAFSADDRYLASAGTDGTITVWDVRTSAPLRSFTAHTNGFAFSVAFDPADPNRLVSAGSDNDGSDNKVKLWNWSGTNLIRSWPIQFSFQWGTANASAFTPDGKRLAAAVGEGAVAIWNPSTGEELLRVSGKSDDGASRAFTVFSLAFSPDGQQLALGGGDGIVHISDAHSGKYRRRLGRASNPVAGVAFTKDGQRLAAAGFDSTVQIWDVNSGEMLWSWRAHTGQSIHAMALSPDNTRLITGAADRTVKLWDINWLARTNHEVLTFRDFTREVQSVTFSHDGRRLAACSVDGTIRMWDASPLSEEDNEVILTINQGVEVRTIDVRSDGRWIAAGGERLPDAQGGKAPVFIWNVRTGRLVHTLDRLSLYLFSASFSPDGRFMAATGDDRDYRGGYDLQLWDLSATNVAVRTQTFPGEGCVFCQRYSPDGRYLVGGAQDGRILVWDAVTGKTNGVLGRHRGAVFELAFSPDGRYLASASHAEEVKIWDATQLGRPQTNSVRMATAVGEISRTLDFSPDSRRLAVATDDRVATVWDVESRANVLRLTSESIHGFRAVAFSPDGRWIASGGTDCRVKVWDADSGRLLHTFRGHKGEVLQVSIFNLPDGPRLISGSRDGTIKFWDLLAVEKKSPAVP